MALKISSTSWWETDTYDQPGAIPDDLGQHAGPMGVALVKANANGSTTDGWGLRARAATPGKPADPGFMVNYMKGRFAPDKYVRAFDAGRTAIALVMRSMNVIAIDIDGKNDGFAHAEELLMGAPPTLAETSKSGTGLHLFYSTALPWDSVVGFGQYEDHNGIVQGVDIRGAGCVYHHQPQRWNTRPLVPLPAHIEDVLQRKVNARAVHRVDAALMESLDDVELILLQENLIDELSKPLKPGSRNASLFGIGSKLSVAKVPDWEERLHKKAMDSGLDNSEAVRIIENVKKYT